MTVLVPGLEARHRVVGPGGEVILNDPTVWPRYKLAEIPGLRSSADADDQRDVLRGRRGEIQRPSVRRGKTVVYRGKILGRNLTEVLLGEANLRKAVRDANGGELADLSITSLRQANLNLPLSDPEAAIQNRIANPSFENDLNGWSVQGSSFWTNAGGVIGRVGGGSHGSFYMRADMDNAAASFEGFMYGINGTFVGGRRYTFSINLYWLGGGTQLQIFAGPGVGGTNVNKAITVDQMAYTRFSLDWTPASTFTGATFFGVRNPGAIGVAVSLAVDAAMLVEGTRTEYFDGSMTGNVWDGAAHASRSFKARQADFYEDMMLKGRGSLEIPEEKPTTRNRIGYGHERPFSLSVRTPEPRIQAASGLSVDASDPTGGSSRVVVVNNDGDTDVDPIISLLYPFTSARAIYNDTTGAKLEFAPVSLVAFSTLWFDFAKRQAFYDGVDWTSNLNLQNSDWWDRGKPGLVPGLNRIRAVGTLFDVDQIFRISFARSTQ